MLNEKSLRFRPIFTIKARLLLLLILALVIFPYYADSFDTKANSAIVFDETSNSVLLEKDANRPIPPASMSKLMTLYLAFEALKEGRIKMSTKFRVSAKASQKGGSKMFLEENELVSVEDLIRGITVASGNDACIALAEGLNGTEDSFVARMNLKARDLKLKNSNFKNSTGWPAPGHRMSAKDLLHLAMHIRRDFPEYYHYFGEKDYTWNGIKQENRNPILLSNIGTDGLKTGHTRESGYGLVGSSVLGARRVTFVITGLQTSSERKIEAEKVTNWAFRDFTLTKIFPKGFYLGSVPIWVGSMDNLKVFTNKEINILIPYGKKAEVSAEVHIMAPIIAPIEMNEAIGSLKIFAPSFIPGNEPRTLDIPLFSNSDIAKGNFSKKLKATAQRALSELTNITKIKDFLTTE